MFEFGFSPDNTEEWKARPAYGYHNGYLGMFGPLTGAGEKDRSLNSELAIGRLAMATVTGMVLQDCSTLQQSVHIELPKAESKEGPAIDEAAPDEPAAKEAAPEEHVAMKVEGSANGEPTQEEKESAFGEPVTQEPMQEEKEPAVEEPMQEEGPASKDPVSEEHTTVEVREPSAEEPRREENQPAADEPVAEESPSKEVMQEKELAVEPSHLPPSVKAGSLTSGLTVSTQPKWDEIGIRTVFDGSPEPGILFCDGFKASSATAAPPAAEPTPLGGSAGPSALSAWNNERSLSSELADDRLAIAALNGGDDGGEGDHDEEDDEEEEERDHQEEAPRRRSARLRTAHSGWRPSLSS